MIDDDDYGFEPDEQFCDCADAEWDLLDGTAKCWSCGNIRILSADEIDHYWRRYSEFEAEMDRINRQDWWDRLLLLWSDIWRRLRPWQRRPEGFATDDEIPF